MLMFKFNKREFVGDDVNFIVVNLLKYLRSIKFEKLDYNYWYNVVSKNAVKDYVSPAGTPSQKAKRNKFSAYIASAFDAARAILNLSAGNIVSEKETMRRAKICLECPLASDTSDCFGCGGSKKIVNKLLELRHETGIDLEARFAGFNQILQKFCGFCGCSLSLITATKIAGFARESEEKNNERPDNCWLKRTSTNYKKDE